MFRGAVRKFASSFPNQEIAKVTGMHFAQEDSPEEVGAAIRTWLNRVS
jgi:haloalkane dehalogenase